MDKMNIFQTNEPSVESDVTRERIHARRLRIQKKIDKTADEDEDTAPTSASRETLSAKGGDEISINDENTMMFTGSAKDSMVLSKKQIEESLHTLEKLLSDGMTLITNVQVAIDAREVLQRTDNEDKKQLRLDKLEHEDKVGTERFLTVNKKWEEVFLKQIPDALQEDLVDQQAACNAIIDEKNKLLDYLKGELTDKEDLFVRNMKWQAEDIKLIVERMNEHIQIMKTAYKEELKAMEMAFTQERQDLLERYLQKWNTVLEEMGAREDKFLHERFKLMDTCEEQADQLWKKEMEEFNNVKQRLENDIMMLELEARNLKANVLVNQEKLEYSYHVLKKRDEESTIMKSNQKRRLTKLHDVMANLKKKLEMMEKLYHEENKHLLEDFKKIVNFLLDLEKKYNHFQTVDIKRYTEVWKLNEEDAKDQARRLLHLDRIIYGQHLALPWTSPDLTFMRNIGPWGIQLSSQRLTPRSTQDRALDGKTPGTSHILSEAAKNIDIQEEDQPSSNSEEEPVTTVTVMESPPPTVQPSPTIETIQVSKGQRISRGKSIITPTTTCKPSASLTQRILLLLCDESGFLIEDRVIRLMEALETNAQNLVKITNIFSALGIFHEKEMNILIKYFLPYTNRVEGSPNIAELESVSEKSTFRRVSLPTRKLIESPIAAVTEQCMPIRRGRSCTSFSEFRSQMSRRMLRKSCESKESLQHLEISPNDILKALRDFVQEQRKVTRLVEKVPILHCYQLVRNKQQDERYWSMYTKIIHPSHLRLWDALIPALEKFHQELVERGKLLHETKQLRCQNAELKHLLEDYLKSKENTSFVLSPTNTLDELKDNVQSPCE